MTDRHPVYRSMGLEMLHEMVNHEIEYVRGAVHTQTIEGYWSLVKRSIYGTYHHVGDGFLPMYLSEMDFRYSHRKITDAERFARLMSQVGGKRLLWFCKTPQPENPHALGLPGRQTGPSVCTRAFTASSNPRGSSDTRRSARLANAGLPLIR